MTMLIKWCWCARRRYPDACNSLNSIRCLTSLMFDGPNLSVGVVHLPNFAALGVALRLGGRSVACVTAHLAADKDGRIRPEARIGVSGVTRALRVCRLLVGSRSTHVFLR
jgi:hypothetical protein